ncbi:MAG TPA: glycerol acyltransferase, partial [Anaerolineae bacterium]|nr:glycerol acyltransferase [Anaerolineae bacterium]
MTWKNRINLPHLGDNVPRTNRPILRLIGKTYLRLARWHFEGELPNVPKLVGIGAPHTAAGEVFLAIAAFWALDLDVQWLAKDSLFRWPLVTLMRWARAFPVDRSKSGGLVSQAIEQFATREQLYLLLAPEGTRKKVDKWKRGF